MDDLSTQQQQRVSTIGEMGQEQKLRCAVVVLHLCSACCGLDTSAASLPYIAMPTKRKRAATATDADGGPPSWDETLQPLAENEDRRRSTGLRAPRRIAPQPVPEYRTHRLLTRCNVHATYGNSRRTSPLT